MPIDLSDPRVRRALFGLGLVAGSWVEVRKPGIARWEETVFRTANEAPDGLRVPVRTVMQVGTLASAPVAAAVAALAGRRSLAVRLLAGGTLAWFGAKAVKPMGGRERPEHVLGTVRLREGIEGDLGWVSGHATVATTLALTATPELPAAAAPVLAGVVATACFGRMYVGAHLPHDLLGGIGLGLIISAALPPRESWPRNRRMRALLGGGPRAT